MSVASGIKTIDLLSEAKFLKYKNSESSVSANLRSKDLSSSTVAGSAKVMDKMHR